MSQDNLHRDLMAFTKYTWTELLDYLGEYRCVLGRDPVEDDYLRTPVDDEQWVVYQFEGTSTDAYPVGSGKSPGLAMISALLTLNGIDESGELVIETEQMTKGLFDELMDAHNTLGQFLSDHVRFHDPGAEK